MDEFHSKRVAHQWYGLSLSITETIPENEEIEITDKNSLTMVRTACLIGCSRVQLSSSFVGVCCGLLEEA